MRILFILLIFIFSVSTVQAATISITGDACANAIAADPNGAVYTPGVDVNGHPVTPAEGMDASPQIQAPTDITIPLQLNLQNALHLPSNNLTAPQAIIGTIEYKNGQVTFNGQPVSSDATADIEAACRQSRDTPPAPIVGHKDLLKGN